MIILISGLKSVSERQGKVELIGERHSQKEKTNQYLLQGEGKANHSFENAADSTDYIIISSSS